MAIYFVRDDGCLCGLPVFQQQVDVFPAVLTGRNLSIQSPTGTGKVSEQEGLKGHKGPQQ
jgi:hypothetical protein